MRISFEKILETRIVRTQYKIGSWKGLSAKSLRESLSQVPDNAVICDFDSDVDIDGIEGDDRYLIFEEEKKEIPKQILENIPNQDRER